MRFVEARAIWFGAMIGTDYGEPYLAPGPVPLRELPGTGPRDKLKNTRTPYCMFT